MHTLIPNPLTTTQFYEGKIPRTVGVILRIKNRYNGKVSSTFEFNPGLMLVYLRRQYAVKTKVKIHVISITATSMLTADKGFFPVSIHTLHGPFITSSANCQSITMFVISFLCEFTHDPHFFNLLLPMITIYQSPRLVVI